jgi:hypothetical protein
MTNVLALNRVLPPTSIETDCLARINGSRPNNELSLADIASPTQARPAAVSMMTEWVLATVARTPPRKGRPSCVHKHVMSVR